MFLSRAMSKDCLASLIGSAVNQDGRSASMWGEPMSFHKLDKFKGDYICNYIF